MTIESALVKMLDIFVSNFLVGMGYGTAALVTYALWKRQK